MKVQTILILFVITLLSLIWALPAGSQQAESERLKLFYGTYINEHIKKCENKMAMQDSRSKNLRHAAEVARLKSAYLHNYKELLIQGMIEDEVGMKPYKLDYYLNKEFFAIARSKDPNVAEAYSTEK
jgi:hypothetical protein